MAQKEKNILKEAIADAKALKEAALSNAQTVILEHLKDNMKQFVEQELNESLQNESELAEGDDSMEMEENYSMTEEEDALDVEEEEEEEDGGAEEFGDEDEMEEAYGLTEDDLAEALESALSEVTHGGLGDMETVYNYDDSSQPTGIEDLDSKEAGWEKKTAPKSTQSKLHTGEQYHQESVQLKRKVAKLVKENVLYKKTNAKLAEALKETKLFNAKLFYASKLMQKEGLGQNTKVKIIQKMDTVKSLSEAKNLYESLELALETMSEKKAPRRKPSLTEAVGFENKASGTGRGVSGNAKQEVVNEGFVRRNQKLAGIIND